RSAAENISFVVNFEAIGGSGASLLVETSGPESWIIEHYSAAVERPAAFSFATEIARLMGDIGTDFDPFRNAGVPGLHFAYMRGSPIYHTSADNIESVSLRSLQHHGDAAVGVIRHFGNLDLRPERSNGTPTYFTVGPLLIKYPAWAAWVGLLAAAALLVAALRRARLSLGRVVAAAGRNAAGILGATIVATLLWILATAVRNTPSAAEAYALLFLIGGFALWVAHRLVGGERNSEFLPGTAVIWIALSLVTVLFLPGSSYLFVWPALAAAIALSVEPLSRGRFVGFVAVAAIALLLLTPAVEFFFQLGQPRPGNPDSSIPAVAVVAFLFVVLGGRLLRGVWWKPSIGSGPFTAPPPPRLERPSET
ncbi:MAG: M28 family peptidase, partial [Acidimicrobiia bacterium]|nr:M28 family peptidase [Acidimicrobiia bacterium]